MKRGEAIRLIKQAGRNGSVRMTRHAVEELANKNMGEIAVEEIAAALAAGTTFDREPTGRWVVYSADYSMTVVVLITDEREVLIWTLYP